MSDDTFTDIVRAESVREAKELLAEYAADAVREIRELSRTAYDPQVRLSALIYLAERELRNAPPR